MINIKSAKDLIKQNRFMYGLLFPIILLKRLILNRKESRFEEFYNSIFKSVVEGSLVVSLPKFRGIFEIDFRSHILKGVLKSRSYEDEFAEIVYKYLDFKKDALDIGANIGLFTILMSKLVSNDSRVLAVEPIPFAIDYLNRNIDRNCCSQSVIVFKGVVTNKEGKVSISTIQGMEEYASIGDIVHPLVQGRSSKSIEVKSSTIDRLVNEFNLKPGFIKIDTEGAEYLVLSGAINTLIKYKPIILSELSDTLLSSFGHRFEEVVNLLQNNGYRIVNARVPSVPLKSPFNGEILALPIENDYI